MISARLLAFSSSDLEAAALAVLEATMSRLGARVAVVVRAPELEARTLLDVARRLASRAATTGSAVFVRDRADVVACFDGDPTVGLYLPERGLSVKEARRVVGPDVRVGCSTHSAEGAAARAAEGADFVVLAPIFPTPSKPATLDGSAPVLGLGDGFGLEAAVARVAGLAPTFALGGVDATNADAVLARGAWGVAAVRAAGSSALGDWVEAHFEPNGARREASISP